MKGHLRGVALALAIGSAAVASAQPQPQLETKPGLTLEDMLTGQSQTPEQRARSIAEAERHPLGSEENPVRVEMPIGERAYLARLRCPDGAAPRYRRLGSTPGKAYPNIADIYEVVCASGTSRVYMDMYHRGHEETRPVPGFTMDTPAPTV